MQSFKTFLAERYVNVFDEPTKEKYADVVWDILQKSYADQGGLKGGGFNSKADMIKRIPFWKLVVRDGKVTSVAMYKDTQGRKRVAIGTDGSESSKIDIRSTVKADVGRAYVEMSGASFFSLNKHNGTEFVEKHAKTVKEAEALLGEKLSPPKKDDPMYEKFPTLRKFMYSRELGGEMKTKIMLGKSGIKIV